MLNQEPRPACAQTGKALPALLIAVTLLIALSPITENWKRKPADSFPLSYYPMFSFRRGDTFTGETLAGYDAAGNRVRLPYKLAGTGGFNQVRRQIRAKVKDRRADEVCEKVARRLSRAGDPLLSSLVRVEVITAKHDVDAFFAGSDKALKEKTNAACEVTRESAVAHNNKEIRP